MSELEALVNQLTALFLKAQGIPIEQGVETLGPTERKRFETLEPDTKRVVIRLLEKAYRNGFPSSLKIQPGIEPLAGGMTAKHVFVLGSEISCVAKVDNSERLAGETKKLLTIRGSRFFPTKFADCYPRVYAAKLDSPPYAYIMEHFNCPPFVALSEWIFKREEPEAGEAVRRVLSIILDVYTCTLDRTLRPNLETTCANRIIDRLEAAASLDDRFKRLLDEGVIFRGRTYSSPRGYVDQIRKRANDLAPPFVGFVHGDAHPGNILVHPKDQQHIKFLDVNEWHAGDYIWDVAKLLHYLMVTGPTEERVKGDSPMLDLDQGAPRLSYRLVVPKKVKSALDASMNEIGKFAMAQGDINWRKRLELSLATNLFGVIPGRIKSGRVSSAIVHFGEGLCHLAQFASTVSSTGT